MPCFVESALTTLYSVKRDRRPSLPATSSRSSGFRSSPGLFIPVRATGPILRGSREAYLDYFALFIFRLPRISQHRRNVSWRRVRIPSVGCVAASVHLGMRAGLLELSNLSRQLHRAMINLLHGGCYAANALATTLNLASCSKRSALRASRRHAQGRRGGVAGRGVF